MPQQYYSQAPPSSHSPQHHSLSQASTPFTTASSVQSPPHTYHIAQPASVIGHPPFGPYAGQNELPASNPPYHSTGAYHPAANYDAGAVYGGGGAPPRNALQLQPPPLEVTVPGHSLHAYHSSSAPYMPPRPSPMHAHSQRMIPTINQVGGRGQPPPHASHAPLPSLNTLPPAGNSSPVSAIAPSTLGSSVTAQGGATGAAGPDSQSTRKRPKYTRSKAGCLVCRQKKVKCDEKKPTCTRCLHGHRECSWPKDVPATSAANRGKSAKSVRGVERDTDNAEPGSATRAGSGDEAEEDVPRSADASSTTFSPIQPHSAGGFGAPGTSYSYPYASSAAQQQQQGLRHASGTTSQAHSRNPSSGSSGTSYSHAGPGAAASTSPRAAGSVVAYMAGPEAGPEPLAPYFRTGQERNLVGFESGVPLPPSIPSLPSLAPTPSYCSPSSHHDSWSALAPPVSFDSLSHFDSSPPSVAMFDSAPSSAPSLLPSPSPLVSSASSFSAPWSSGHLSVGYGNPHGLQLSPTSSHSSSSSPPMTLYAAPMPVYAAAASSAQELASTGLEWLQLDGPEPYGQGVVAGYQ